MERKILLTSNKDIFAVGLFDQDEIIEAMIPLKFERLNKIYGRELGIYVEIKCLSANHSEHFVLRYPKLLAVRCS